MPGRVIVVGSVNVDLVASVDRLPAPGETVTGASFARHPGGKGGNQAVAAARLGARVTFVGAVGDDPLADEARAALAGQGVDVAPLATVSGPTGVALILVDRAGENVIAVAAGANGGVDPAAVEAGLASLGPGPGDVVLVSNEIPLDAVSAALRAGRVAGATTVLNPAPATGLGRRELQQADIVVPNRGELHALVAADDRATGRAVPRARGDPVDEARHLLVPNSQGGGVRGGVAVTLGAGGAVLITSAAEARWFPAVAVDAVDTVGAGDAFVGALAAGLAEGRPLDEAVRRGVAAASLSTTKAGARGGMPTLAELEGALATN